MPSGMLGDEAGDGLDQLSDEEVEVFLQARRQQGQEMSLGLQGHQPLAVHVNVGSVQDGENDGPPLF